MFIRRLRITDDGPLVLRLGRWKLHATILCLSCVLGAGRTADCFLSNLYPTRESLILQASLFLHLNVLFQVS